MFGMQNYSNFSTYAKKVREIALLFSPDACTASEP